MQEKLSLFLGHNVIKQMCFKLRVITANVQLAEIKSFMVPEVFFRQCYWTSLIKENFEFANIREN